MMKFYTQEAINLEKKYGANNYAPLPVVLERGNGVYVWDVEGRRYYDFLSAYSAVNQGHVHPRILNVMIKQASKLTLTSRAFYSDQLGLAEKKLCNLFGYERAILMNTGAEGNETAIKLARKWGYEKKGIPKNEAIIVGVEKNFHGRTTTIISASTDPVATTNFGPFMPGFEIVPYNNLEALEEVLQNPNVAGLWMEPIQGEAGVYLPDEGYLRKAQELCHRYNVLFMVDEVQTGVGRTGKLLASEYEEIKPDMIILGKAISGGFYPVSAVLTSSEVMDVFKPGQHGSTYGGNPLGCAVMMEALDVLIDEKLTENAYRLGKIFRKRMRKLCKQTDLLLGVRGKGLLNALLVNDSEDSATATLICHELMHKGLLAKPTHGNIIRFAPPLVITESQLEKCMDIIEDTVLNFELVEA
ncbi:ornithine--oxo-acid transaminase [Flammeovirga yaeyamensis]|uniref:ornithine aminotransferase n=1 Tax=Flammeovirga yaeyamensis TaxID=367791 RepID=A0AAX1NA96_9BACT|nr:ornithine--oxo-acid transaminase [Flammeovirga yaeyamensis]MBB3699461.1 ornithine--oxo-acid transaminase [Flammeovirga yaeyamensis]NMF35282.1 ornithine--oxo-acid transaminase [Flammeovirga yaeyamensis]QWG04142.1 ornithine--oxo-acid transaminase [Flammeovirga yaeyamensis]